MSHTMNVGQNEKFFKFWSSKWSQDYRHQWTPETHTKIGRILLNGILIVWILQISIEIIPGQFLPMKASVAENT